MDNMAWFMFGVVVGQQLYAYWMVRTLTNFLQAQKGQDRFLE